MLPSEIVNPCVTLFYLRGFPHSLHVEYTITFTEKFSADGHHKGHIVATATSGSFVSSSIVNQVRLYNAVYVLFIAVILGGWKGDLFPRPEGRIRRGFI